MTRDQIQSVHDDIAYMKALAVEGQKTPLLGGSVLISAGLVFGLAAVGHYLIDSDVLNLPPISYAVLWGAAMLIFFGVLMVQTRAINRKPGAHSPVNRAVDAGWMGVGLAVFVLFLSMGVVSWKMGSAIPFMIFPSLILALYGSAWAVSATMSRTRWQWYLAIGAWACAPLIALLIGTAWLWLGYAASLFLLALVPGIVLVRQEPAEVI